MPEFNTKGILTLSDDDEALKLFFVDLKRAGRILVEDGSEQFVVEYQRVQMTDAARKLLVRGPAGD